MKGTVKREYYIDNLRTMIIGLVIMLHLAVTYSSLGIWYYNERVAHGFFGQVFFATFQMFTQSFSMGLMFLLAGYFTPASFDKKGFGRFFIDRFRRLVIPALLYLLVITPFVCWTEVPGRVFTGGAANFTEFYGNYLRSGGMKFLGIGPMWFAVALFGFSVFYALARLILPAAGKYNSEKKEANLVLAGVILAVAAGAFLLRLFFPIGSIFWGMQLPYFSQYVLLFAAGIFAYRTKFFERLNPATSKKWLAAGLIAGTAGLIALKIAAGMYDLSTFTIVMNPAGGTFAGGVSWKSISFAILESFIAVSLSAGLITLFREKVNFTNSLTKSLSGSSFAVYMFHPPIIIAVTLAMQALLILPVAKWVIASIISVPLCFFLAYRVLLRIPLLNKIL